MNKEKFLKELTKKLSVLSYEERQDTINEYSDIIDEKVNHGKTEIEAVSEFGSIEELAKEILSAYKIDPKYSESDKSIADNVEDIIKKGAKKISDVTEDVVDNFKKSDFSWNTNDVIEIAIKVVLLLIVLAFLKIPFYIISELGSSIFSIGIAPFNDITSFIWRFIVDVAYFIICVLLIVNIINKYTSRNTANTKEEVIKEVKDDKKKETENEIKREDKRQVRQPRKNNASDALSEIMIAIIKIFCVICFLLPAFGILFSGAILIAVAIYLLIKGVMLYGILVLLIGGFMFVASFIDCIFNLIFNHKKLHIYPFVISIIICIVGLFLSIDYVDDYKYIDSINSEAYNVETINYSGTVNSTTVVNSKYDVLIDETLLDNQIKVEVTYFKDYVTPTVLQDTYNNEINISLDYRNQFGFDNNIIEDLKNKTVYDYSLLGDVKVKLYMNTKTSVNFIRG